MINRKFRQMLSARSVIRELSEYATARAAEIGRENIYDFTLGNPSVPVADDYTRAVVRLHEEEEPVALHGYSPSPGIESVRAAVAESLRRRFGLPYETKHIFMSSGAAGAIAHAIRAVTEPGDEVIVFAPYFPEYDHYINETGARLKLVPPDEEELQISMDALDGVMNEKVNAILINSPNNPSGVVYSGETLEKLTSYMYEKQKEYGHDIFLISDEPYREIVFDGGSVPYPASFYDNTLTCYSFSKSLSLPGERIGYVAVNPAATDADILTTMFCQISRGIGHNCPSSSVQRAVAMVIDETADLSVYETNRNLLYDALTGMGYDVIKPGGTFYMFPKAPGGDAVAFCKKALEKDLIFVPADGFGIKGYFRIAFCVDTDMIKRAIPVIEEFTIGVR